MPHHLPEGVASRGNADLLQKRTLGLFCSARCPSSLILQAHDFARDLRDPDLAVIGGFHSSIEKECLTLFLRGGQPVIVCLARSLDRLRLPVTWKPALQEQRMFILSPFERGHRRSTGVTAAMRNLLVVDLADEILVPHAAPGSKTEWLCRDIAAAGKPLLTVDSADNTSLMALGARPVGAGSDLA
ncbi:MAG: DNA-binding protein [Chloroflexota bacterium]|nr:DNA-binding protein [Chloroflexota bacterium]